MLERALESLRLQRGSAVALAREAVAAAPGSVAARLFEAALLAISRDVLWTPPHAEPAIDEWIRVLRPSGRLVVPPRRSVN